jgi:integrase
MPHQLSAALVQETDDTIRRSDWSPTYKATTAIALRRLLRWLWTNHGAPKLDNEVSKYPAIRPRSVTVDRDELDSMLGTAPPPLHLWLLFCSHLAIRSGTAVRLGPQNYDEQSGVLRFITKKQAPVVLPATEEIRALLAYCDQNNPAPFIQQLWKRFAHRRIPAPTTNMNATMQNQMQKHRTRLGFTKRVTAHDLRRTAAVALYELTGDIRDVQALLGHRSLQSTIWYLDHDLRPVKLANLEYINRPRWEREKTA